MMRRSRPISRSGVSGAPWGGRVTRGTRPGRLHEGTGRGAVAGSERTLSQKENLRVGGAERSEAKRGNRPILSRRRFESRERRLDVSYTGRRIERAAVGSRKKILAAARWGIAFGVIWVGEHRFVRISASEWQAPPPPASGRGRGGRATEKGGGGGAQKDDSQSHPGWHCDQTNPAGRRKKTFLYCWHSWQNIFPKL